MTQQNELLFAQIAAATINYSQRAPKETVKVEALMPSRWDKMVTPKRRPKKQVVNDLRSIVKFYADLQSHRENKHKG